MDSLTAIEFIDNLNVKEFDSKNLNIIGIEEPEYDFRFGISPNPTESGIVKFVYLLPQNKSGELNIYSITGQLVYKQYLPPWSSLQLIDLSDMQGGIYTCVLTSGTHRTAKKLVVISGSGAK